MSAHLPQLSEEAIAKAEAFQLGVDPWPDPAEFSSLEAALDFAEAISRRNHGLPLRTAGPVGKRTSDRRGSRQVGLRLPVGDYERLREIAAYYGVAPATMARMLVVRMVRGWT